MKKKPKVIRPYGKKILYGATGITTIGAVGASVAIPLIKKDSKNKSLKKEKEVKAIAHNSKNGFEHLKDTKLSQDLQTDINILGTDLPRKVAKDVIKKEKLAINEEKDPEKWIHTNREQLLYVFSINSQDNSEKNIDQKIYLYFSLKDLKFLQAKLLTFEKEKLVKKPIVKKITKELLSEANRREIQKTRKTIVAEKARILKEQLAFNANKIKEFLILPEDRNSKLPSEVKESDFSFKQHELFDFEIKKTDNDSLSDDSLEINFFIKDKSSGIKLDSFKVIVDGFKSKSKEAFNSITKDEVKAKLPIADPERLAKNVFPSLPKKATLSKQGLLANVSFEFVAGIGEIEWIATVKTDLGYKKVFSGVIKGYKTIAASEAQKSSANQKIKEIKDSLSTPKLKDYINKDKTTADQVVVNDFKTILTGDDNFEAKIQELKVKPGDDKTLLVIVEIKSTKFSSTDVTPEEKTFEISGFTTIQEIQDKLKAQEQKRLESELQKVEVSFSKKRSSLSLNEQKDIIPNLLSITDINQTAKTYSYKINESGTSLNVTVKYESTKFSDVNIQKTFTLTGFLNERDQYEYLFNEYYNFLTKKNLSNFQLISGNLRSQKHISELSIDDFSLLSLGENFSKYIDINLDFFSTSESEKENNTADAEEDNTTGFIHWTIRSKKYGFQKSGFTKIDDFQDLKAKKEKLKNKKLEADFKQLSKDDILSEIEKRINSNQEKSEMSAEDINKIKDFEFTYGESQLNVSVNIISWIQDKSEGKINWKVNVETQKLLVNKSKQLSGSIVGFKIIDEQDSEKQEKAETNRKLDEALVYLQEVSDYFSKLYYQGAEEFTPENIQKSGHVSVNFYGKKNLPWGIPYLPRFAGYVDNLSSQRLKYKLIDYLKKIQTASTWDWPGGSKTLDPLQSNGKINSNFEFKINFGSARINPDDVSQLLIDVEFYSKKYPNLRREYTVTYTGFKKPNIITDDDATKAFYSKLDSALKKYNSTLGTDLNYLFGALLDAPKYEKTKIFCDKLLSGEFKSKINWEEYEKFVDILNKIKNTDNFKALKDEINIWKDKVLTNTKKYDSLNREDPFENLNPMIQKLINEIFSSNISGANPLLTSREQNLLKFGMKQFQTIIYNWIHLVEDGENDKIGIKPPNNSERLFLTSSTYWKDLLGSEKKLSEFYTTMLSMKNKIRFEKINAGSLIRAIVEYTDDKYGFDSIKFYVDLPSKYFITEEEKINQLKEDIERQHENNSQSVIALQGDIFPDKISVSEIITDNIDLLFDNLDTDNFKFEVSKISKDDSDETVANVHIKIISKAYPNITGEVVLQIGGFATEGQVESIKGTIADDQDDLGEVTIETIKEEVSLNDNSDPDTFAEDVAKPSDFVLAEDVKGRFTSWEVEGTSIKYQITLSKGAAKRRISGQINGFKQLQNFDDNFGTIDIQKDSELTSKIWKLYYETLINPSKKKDLEKYQKEILKDILESNHFKAKFETDTDKGWKESIAQLKKILSYKGMYIDQINLSKLENSNHLNFDLTFKSKLKPDFKQKLTFKLDNLLDTFEKIRNDVSELKVTAKGIWTTDFSSLKSLFLKIKESSQNSDIIKEIISRSILNDDDTINEKALVDYLIQLLEMKFSFLKENVNQISDDVSLDHQFVEALYQKAKTSDILKHDPQNTKWMTLKYLAEEDQILKSVLEAYSQKELFTDLKELVEKIAQRFINDETQRDTFVNSFLEKMSFRISGKENNRNLLVYFEPTPGERSYVAPVQLNEGSVNDYIKLDFALLIQDFATSLGDWSKEFAGTLKRNTQDFKIFKLLKPIEKEFFKKLVLGGTGNRVQILSIFGLNIFGESIADIFKSYDNARWLFYRGTGKWGSGTTLSEVGDFEKDSPQTNPYSGADDVDDIYRLPNVDSAKTGGNNDETDDSNVTEAPEDTTAAQNIAKDAITSAQNTAKDAINDAFSKAPEAKDDDGDQALFDAITTKKDVALAAIGAPGKTVKQINEAKDAGKTAVEEAIKAYNDKLIEVRTTAADLATAKEAHQATIEEMKSSVNPYAGVTVPQAALAIFTKAKSDAKDTIGTVTDPTALQSTFEAEKAKVEAALANLEKAITDANKAKSDADLATAKEAHQDTIEEMKSSVNPYAGVTVPQAALAIFTKAKSDAKDTIGTVTDPTALQSTFEAEKAKVEAALANLEKAITDANKAKSDADLATAKEAHQDTIEEMKSSVTPDAGVTVPQAALAIFTKAKSDAKDTIGTVTDPTALQSTFEAEKAKVQAALEKLEQAITDANEEEANRKLDEALVYLQEVSDYFSKLYYQGAEEFTPENIQKSGHVSVNFYGKKNLPWGIPYLPRFAGYVDNTIYNRGRYKLIDYLKKIQTASTWDWPGGSKTLDPLQSNGKINSNFEFKINFGSARINPDDVSQLLIDVEFYSKKYPNLRREYTVTYKGFKKS